VTVQLPIYNERHVVTRLIDSVCRQDYPRELLEVQVLDDSTDETSRVAQERTRFWRDRGVLVSHLRRGNRAGFKAGALACGLEQASGEFILILDADFVAPPTLVRRLLAPFVDPEVGMVQGRWDHLNEADNRLTRVQALLLDGHFFFEHGGRYASGCFFNFNGTAGMWRRASIEDAGGWHTDTLTEDLDLSYRAQMRGWRFVFLEDVGVPAELPAEVGAFEMQQKRWAQGGIQTARKTLPRLLRGDWPLRIKMEAVIHLCGHLAHPLTLMLGLLIYPSALARRALGLENFLTLDLVVFLSATVPFLVFYSAAGRKRDRPWRRVIPGVLATLAVGIGLTVSVSRAVFRGLLGFTDPFVRTPKKGRSSASGYGMECRTEETLARLALGGVLMVLVGASIAQGFYGSIPFLLLFASGYLGLGITGLRSGGTKVARAAFQSFPEKREIGGHPDEEPHPGRVGPDSGLQVQRNAPVRQEYEAA
jgi:cellulose synthase/poly-beta-1,6-N-acetylglucosamine synthase-like glycosyltransferase